ncbi:Non-specific serine/threonine protein kinase [Petrotoga mobilis SJ95]|uniref:Non-specific serine/threonine protein kinase n=1 Tax=Petrotoga mobilis (strain DSM 10674 / SJ95) TaxID=403833 RepID=A9BJ91_PETMO|nr:SNF2-related protein [Petrotoga mobilis]ABX31036.1 Non-specific serine/threonine protein kinase [Petrotoga mobilis SJ95]
MGGKYIFGKSWWGKKWVEALENIDRDTNRLPRGRNYAKKGAVLEIKIQKNSVISARVQGTRPNPYREKIALPSFTEEEKEKIKKVLNERLDLSAMLIGGNLPEELLDITENMGIKLFPKSWNEINAHCTCPDWANPCKHLAAVYYIIADEIDKDPFLIFEMHGMKKKDLIEIAKETEKTSDSIFTDKKEEPSKPMEQPDPSYEKYEIEKVINLLPDEAYFYDGKNFKNLLLRMYNQLSKAINEEDGRVDEEFNPYFKETEIKFVYSPITPNIILDGEPLEELKCKKEKSHYTVYYEDLFDLFGSIPLVETDEDSEASLFLKRLVSFVYRLIDMKAFIPTPQKINEEEFVIDYSPVYFNDYIRDYVNYLNSIVPGGLVINEKGQYMKRDKIVEYLVSQYIKYLIKKYYKSDVKNKITDVFFESKVYTAQKFEEKRTYESIKNYLEPLLLRQSKYQLVISIEDMGELFFNLSLDIYRKDEPFDTYQDIKTFFESQEDGKSEVLKEIVTIAKYAEFFGEFLKKKSSKIMVNTQQLSEIMINAMPILKLLNVEILAPKGLQKVSRPKLVLKANSTGSHVSFLSLSKLIRFNYTVLIGDSEISLEEFEKLAKKSKGIVKIKENYVFLGANEFEAIMEKVKNINLTSDFETLKVILSQEMNVLPVILDNNLQKFLEELRKVSPVRLPKNLNAELRHYQKTGFRWLYTNLEKGFNVCIADDMGLGKTIQVISVILKMKEEKALENPVLVVCPTTLVGNWYKECEKFAPTLNVSIYHGSDRKFEDNSDVIITTYSVVRNDVEFLTKKEFSMVVVDEAQNIKNSDTQQTKAVKALYAPKRIAMTGTPIENRLTELWSLYDFLMSGYLGGKNRFIETFAKPIEKYGDTTATKRLQSLINPFLIRRIKTDKNIIKDLPEKFTYDEYVYLKPSQIALYKEVVEHVEEELEKMEADGIQRKGLILKMLTSLKQICNHPVNYTKKGVPLPDDSGKTEKLLDLLQNIVDNNEKVVLFTQYKEMGDILTKILADNIKIEPLFFHGGLNRKKRDKMINDFQTKHRYPIMILSLKAGGTGLNLTAANHVIHYDLWWNPAVESQATDRTFRIGQTKDVIVHRFITLETFEEKINEMLEKKKELSENIIKTGESWITELSNQEIKNLFKLGN